MSETEGKYAVNIAQSDEKASTVVVSFKVRKSGNSSNVTVPNVVKETLDVKDGKRIQSITVKEESDESIVVKRKVKNDQLNQDMYDNLLDETFDELDDILEALVEL